MTPFVGFGSIHEAMSVRGEFSTITSWKFIGAEGTTELDSTCIKIHTIDTNICMVAIEKMHMA